MLGDLDPGLGIVHRQPGAPLEVSNERGAELRIAGQSRVVGGEAHKRGKPEPLLGRDPEAAVVSEHVLVAAEVVGVAARSTEDLAPPDGDVVAMLLAHAAGKEG